MSGSDGDVLCLVSVVAGHWVGAAAAVADACIQPAGAR